MLFLELLPPALQENPVWVKMAQTMDVIWGREINTHVVSILNLRNMDVVNAPREQVLKFAHHLGWTFPDTFGADWNADPRAERFLRTFVSTWSEFCRLGKERASFIDYMSLLLGMKLTCHVLWTNERTTPYDGSPDDNFYVGGTVVESYSEIPYGTLVRKSDLDVQYPGWNPLFDFFEDPPVVRTVDPVNGWYPTTHVELEYSYTDIVTSALGLPPDSIIVALFNKLAPIEYVLKNVTATQGTVCAVVVSSGYFTEIEVG